MGAVESYRANGEGPGVEGLDKLYPGDTQQGTGGARWRWRGGRLPEHCMCGGGGGGRGGQSFVQLRTMAEGSTVPPTHTHSTHTHTHTWLAGTAWVLGVRGQASRSINERWAC
jgi:hypothetical protein